jgi:FKBP-type peptidyl-prolyl cis-trans isomerase FkpA
MKRSISPSRVLLRGALVAAAFLLACNDDIAGLGPPSDPATETFAPSLNVNIATMTRHSTGIYVRDDTLGTGDEAKSTSDTVVVNYAGFLKDGTLFDSGTNTTMPFGTEDLIAGFRNGIIGMKVGGKRKIVIPSDQGYGGVSQKDGQGQITIPRQSTLVFDVKLLRVHTPAPPTPVTLRDR